ncbi:magnesium transporter [Marinospirillum sp. MEB164]|uniref:Magnesium transporter MgtE n=1 Tax=Marinospirillum alkalitolerans TaxID=3123374 RepID=A0ABW8PXL0_9GAMM
MSIELIQQEVLALKMSQNAGALRRLMQQYHLADMAEALKLLIEQQRLNQEELRALLWLMPLSQRAQIFGYLPMEIQLQQADHLSVDALAKLLEAMPHDERVDVYNGLATAQKQAVLALMQQHEQQDIQKLASYPQGSVGAVMTSDFAVLEPQMTAAEALAAVRRYGREKETIYQAYVLNDSQQLMGTLSLKELILAEPEEVIADFMVQSPITLRVEEDQEKVAQLISKYDLLAVPVLNGGDRMVGIVTYDDAMDVARAEGEEDFQRMAGVTDGVEMGHKGQIGQIATSLKDATISLLYKKRVFWLVLLVFGNIFSGAGIAYFEDTIEAYIALVFFLPLLVDSGGNAGSQSATLMVRALATGEVVLKDWASMLGRELVVAGLLGATMAVAVSVLGIWRGGMEIALVVALTMQLVVVVGSMIGMSLPFLLSRLKFDPATASAPLITSVADAVGVVIYFAIATMILDIPLA